LVRVLGHEINNSLAPIRSVAESLRALVVREVRPREWESDLASGLSIIARRSESLHRFLAAYSQLARLPPPQRQTVDVLAWVRRVVTLETRREVALVPGPACSLGGDNDQLDQLLINLVRNAVEASLETGGEISVTWSLDERDLHLEVSDEGPGILNDANLFVPFFTTKEGGTGIGLALSRQIAENHFGALDLRNRVSGPGAVAHLRLPRAAPSAVRRP
jgi:signal transduction histidine kinase